MKIETFDDMPAMPIDPEFDIRIAWPRDTSTPRPFLPEVTLEPLALPKPKGNTYPEPDLTFPDTVL